MACWAGGWRRPSVIRTSRLPGGLPIPARVETGGGEPLEVWAKARRSELRRALREHGALLFRGCGVGDPERFAAFLAAADLPLMDYPRGTSPRTAVGPRIYTSSEVRPDVAIPLHTEMSYTSLYPQAVAFCCVTPATSGGATPLADMRRVLARLPAGLAAEFGRRGLRYVQIVPPAATPALPKAWPEMFGTADRAEVERQAAAQGIACEWLGDGSLRLENRCPALRPHPVTGEPVWFNQAHVFHLKLFEYLEGEGVADAGEHARRFRAARRADAEARDLEPYQCTFGDGGEIPLETMDEVRRALGEECVRFAWASGDVLLLDNFRVGHGRDSFQGPRRLLAALISEL